MMKVYQAINAVQRALSKEGITKDRVASGFGAGYSFRGIDDVYNTLSPLLSEHGLVIIPRCLERIETQRPSGNSKILYFVAVKMEFDFISAEDGSKHTACTYGEAMDSGDKATNKAMSIAYKYACFQTFAIPTEGDNDPDATVHAPAPAGQQNRAPGNNRRQGNNDQHTHQQQQMQSQDKRPANNGQQPKATDQKKQPPNFKDPNTNNLLPSELVLKYIGLSANVEALAEIRDYVAMRTYTPEEVEVIKGAFKSRHSTIMQAAQANY